MGGENQQKTNRIWNNRQSLNIATNYPSQIRNTVFSEQQQNYNRNTNASYQIQ